MALMPRLADQQYTLFFLAYGVLCTVIETSPH